MRVWADFNGLFGGILCLTHQETAKDEHGRPVNLEEGMEGTAFDLDADEEGIPDNIIASGTVERPPSWLSCRGSRWVLRIDERGVMHESDVKKTDG
ncbi:MAG TPA: hypothetical protein VKB38_12685 [Terracidiphilus sp.]|nr:hypothetical protein [Terracidiphilus sp.]